MPRLNFRSSGGSYRNPNETPPPRRPLLEVLGDDSGASPRGSTYYGQLMSCPREFALSQVAGLEPDVPAEQLTLGILYHKAREVFYDTIYDHQQKLEHPKTRVQRDHFFWGATRRAQTAAWECVNPISTEPGYENTWFWLDKVLNAYFEAYDRVDQWEVIATEVPVEVKTKEFWYTTRLDLVVYDWQSQGYWVNEAKTAKFITEDLVDNYQMDFQVLGESFMFPRTYGYDKPFLGVCVDIVSKQDNPKCVRVPCSPSTAHVRQFEHSLLAFSGLRKVYEELSWPKALGHCAGARRGYSKCPYYSICHDFPHLDIEEIMEGNAPDGFHFSRKRNEHKDPK